MLKTVAITASAGGPVYKGTWDANANVPTLVSSVGTANQYYVVSVAGNTNLNGITNWQVGDWAIFNGTVWQKVDGGSYGAVTQVQGNGTVNGITLTGNVTTAGNLTLGGTLSGVTNAQLQNSAITITGTSVPLGGSISTIPVANVAGAVPNTTYIIAGSGLTGGGALTGNVTLTATNTNSGTVTQVQGNGSVNGITLTGNVTSSGNITLGGTLSNVNLTTQVTGTLPVANGGTGAVSLSSGSFLVGNGTSAITTGAFGVNGNGALTITGSAGSNSQVLISTGGGTLNQWSNTLSNISISNVTINSGTINVTSTNHTATTANTATFSTSALPLVPQGYINYDLNGTIVKIPYYAV